MNLHVHVGSPRKSNFVTLFVTLETKNPSQNALQGISAEDEIPPAGGRRYLGALPGGPGKTFDLQPAVHQDLWSVSAARLPRTSSRPTADENSQLLAQLAVNQGFAERTRFELVVHG